MNAQIRQNVLLIALALSVFLASMGTSMANLALPAIGVEFGIDFSTVRMVVLGYLLAITVFSLVVGRFADVKGRHVALLCGTAVFMVAAFIAASAVSFWILVLARVLQGLGGAALVVLPIVIATEAVSSEKTGRSIGLLATMSAVGTVSGPAVGGLILASYGWRSVFLVMASLSVLNLILLSKVVLARGADEMKRGGSQKRDGAIRALLLDSSLRIQLLYNLVVSAVMMTTLIVGPFYLMKNLALAPVSMGFVMSAGPLTSIVAGLFSGVAVDRFGTRFVIKLGFTLLLIGSTSFVFLPANFGIIGFVTSAVLLSLGYQLFLSANSSSVMTESSTERRGLVSGALSLSRNVGLISGTTVLGSVFDSTATRYGLQAVFISAALLIATSFTIYIFTEQRGKK